MRLVLVVALLLSLLSGAQAEAPSVPPSNVAPDQATEPAAPEPTAPVATTPAVPTPPQSTLPPLTDEQFRQLLTVVQEAQRKAAVSAPPPPAPAPAVQRPRPAPNGPVIAKALAPEPLRPDSLGAEFLVHASKWLQALSKQMAATGRLMANFPAIWPWLTGVFNDQAGLHALIQATWRILAVLAGAFVVEFLAGRLVARPLARLVGADAPIAAEDGTWNELLDEASAPQERRFLHHLPGAVLRFILELIPIAGFALVGALSPSLSLFPADSVASTVLLTIVNGYWLIRLVIVLSVVVVSPGHPGLRLLPVSDSNAAYVVVWARRLAILAIGGLGLADIGDALGLDDTAYDALSKLVILLVHLSLVLVVLQNRHSIGEAIARLGGRRLSQSLARHIAAVWHYVAIFVILGVWVVWASDWRDGYAQAVHYFVLTLIVLVLARLVRLAMLAALDRGFRIRPAETSQYPGLAQRANRYYTLLRHTVSAIVNLVMLFALLQIWGVSTLGWFAPGQFGSQLISAIVTIVVTTALAVLGWELLNVAIERQLAKLGRDGQAVRVARLRTLQPMLRTAMALSMLVLVGLTILSEIGVNIAPLLAGAGIVGVAVGFGSQKLVQDFITGIFLLLENAMQVGDWVTLAGLSGTVEELSIRTIRLRAGDGSVHVIPFSAVTTVTNMNRGRGNASVGVTVAAHEDIDRVFSVLEALGAELRADPAFQDKITGDLELWGVDKIDGGTTTVSGQIPCTDAGRWPVQREFNRRLKQRFTELGIELANPGQSYILQPAPAQPLTPAVEGR